MIQEMTDKGYIKGQGLPFKLAPFPGCFPIYDATEAIKLSIGYTGRYGRDTYRNNIAS